MLVCLVGNRTLMTLTHYHVKLSHKGSPKLNWSKLNAFYGFIKANLIPNLPNHLDEKVQFVQCFGPTYIFEEKLKSLKITKWVCASFHIFKKNFQTVQ